MNIEFTEEEAETLRMLVRHSIASRAATINARLKAGWEVDAKSAKRLVFLRDLLTKMKVTP